jgi:hypothetical protein
MVVAEYACDCRKKYALSVRTSPISEEQSVLAGQTSQPIAEDALDVGDKLTVTAGYAIEEGEETRTLAFWRNSSDFCNVVFGNMRS